MAEGDTAARMAVRITKRVQEYEESLAAARTLKELRFIAEEILHKWASAEHSANHWRMLWTDRRAAVTSATPSSHEGPETSEDATP